MNFLKLDKLKYMHTQQLSTFCYEQTPPSFTLGQGSEEPLNWLYTFNTNICTNWIVREFEYQGGRLQIGSEENSNIKVNGYKVTFHRLKEYNWIKQCSFPLIHFCIHDFESKSRGLCLKSNELYCMSFKTILSPMWTTRRAWGLVVS